MRNERASTEWHEPLLVRLWSSLVGYTPRLAGALPLRTMERSG